MKKYFCIVLLAFMCFFCQCEPKDMNERLASYIEHNEQNIEGLRDWDIYFETERSFWSCRHWLSHDSLLSFLHIYVDQNNRFLHIQRE